MTPASEFLLALTRIMKRTICPLQSLHPSDIPLNRPHYPYVERHKGKSTPVDPTALRSSIRRGNRPMLQITPWERSALQLLANGAQPQDIARHLEVPEAEAEERLAALMARMGATGYPDAIAAAARRGLLRV